MGFVSCFEAFHVVKVELDVERPNCLFDMLCLRCAYYRCSRTLAKQPRKGDLRICGTFLSGHCFNRVEYIEVFWFEVSFCEILVALVPWGFGFFPAPLFSCKEASREWAPGD